ncbi:sensor histidine kinase [Paenibacillus bouchesdurhonensis]|uniref:sensor histidine kinase n=1 Tax=Paenibacillus bouchesdurhonensis TaxID=1870990 RepID=UPI000DA619AE|nr:sensor histidine kinase [Paenibacillus bouchesdurhonensis]
MIVLALLLALLAALSIGLNIIQLASRRRREASLVEISKKLSRILNEQSAERLLLFTDDTYLQSLVSDIERVRTESQKIAVRYAKTEQSMKKMLANISHDLKTPLTVILGYIEIIQSEPAMDRTERTRLLHNIQQKTMEIITLMNSFFDLAKLESGDQQVALTKVHMNEICRKNILSFYEAVHSSGMEAVIEIPDPPIYAYGDEEALSRILTNLLSNAIRYGHDGRTLGLNLTADEAHVRIEVWDRGKGIQEQNLERVFERMFTLEESRNRSFQGSGLGLTITKRLVEAMDGTISLHSLPYQRTAFIIQLRRAAQPNLRFS